MWQIVAISWSQENDIGVSLGDYDTVTYQDLTAIIVRSGFRAIENLRPLERVDALFNYQSVIERAGINRNILPVRFGTIAGTKKDAMLILRKDAQKFRSLLRFAEGKAELDLMGIWKEKTGSIEHNLFEDLENQGYEIKVHQPANKAICFHLSILITPNKQETFATYKEELDRKFGDRIDLRLSELLPPYSFLTVDVKKSKLHNEGI